MNNLLNLLLADDLSFARELAAPVDDYEEVLLDWSDDNDLAEVFAQEITR